MMNGIRRGALIVLEGCDRSGKTTQCKRIVSALNQERGDGLGAEFMRFPDRSTRVGQMIDEYLKGGAHLDDHVIHLLFSANRWERVADMRAALEAGKHVIVDRYAFSGVAFSAAKDGMGLDWCRMPDSGLPKPDLVCFLDVSTSEAAKRGEFGRERYETVDFQSRVKENYKLLLDDDYWKVIDTDSKNPDQVFEELKVAVTDVLGKGRGELSTLWPLEESRH